jgi:hypothetical protein
MELLQSKEFWAMVVGLAVTIIVSLVPQLEPSKTEIINAVMVIVGAVLLAFGGEKIAAARASGSTAAERLSAKSESLKVPTVKSP